MLENIIYGIATLITAGIPALYFIRTASREKAAREKLASAVAAGLTEPVSLHPKIDPNRCIETGACLSACPEGEILGIINGQAELISPTKCIGHGACQSACPVEAISLVFGTERRGVEIPHVTETFETNSPGIYIAGELGGMGLIRNAMTQGREAVEYIQRSLDSRDDSIHDLLIVGAGPAGLAATLQAKKAGLRYVTLDQDDVGGTILTYPRQKLVMTQPMEIPLFGTFKKREIRKEELLALWQHIVREAQISINTFEKVEAIERVNGHFAVATSKQQYQAKRVLLAIGRRGTPRKLGVPGEQSSKVAYKLMEPEQYQHKKILVIGGGDSAVEAALALSEQPGNEVTLSYRKEVFSRIKEGNRSRIEQAITQGQVRALFSSTVHEIRQDSVILNYKNEHIRLANDFVFIFIGGELPTAFLKKLGIKIEKKFGER